MKYISIYVIALQLLLSNFQLKAQLPHTSQSPPVNPGYPFTRSLNVDCADEIISDMANGNLLNLEQELFNYVRNNFIGYIILSGMEHSNVFGNPQLENALSNFMIHARDSFPGIQIGIGGSDAGIFQSSGPMTVTLPFNMACFPKGMMTNINDLNNALNNTGLNNINLKRSELCKFFLKAAQFGHQFSKNNSSKYNKYGFDSFYLEYRYWNFTTSLTAMQNEFLNFKTILSFMKILKCNYNCTRFVEAEFLPNEIYNLQAWTAIDQITEADPLMDRMMLPAFTNNADGVFDMLCKTMHFLSDRFSKPRTTYFIEMSAEDNSFNFCNSTVIPHNYLGDYLNGSVIPNGNLYSVERSILKKFNNVNYMCSSCSCRPYSDNHYSINNVYGNVLAGSLWTPYSMLKDHNLFRTKEKVLEKNSESEIIQIQLVDLNGRVMKTYRSRNDYEKDKSQFVGIYFLKIEFADGFVKVERGFSR